MLSLFVSCILPSQSTIDYIEITKPRVERAITDADFPKVHMLMEYQMEKKGKLVEGESGNISLAFSGSRYALITRSKEVIATIIVDLEGKTMTTISSDKNGTMTGVKMPLIRLGNGLFDNLDQTVEQTEEVKSILGYDCRKYIITTDGDVTESWVANIPGMVWGDLAKSLIGGKKSGSNKLVSPIKDMPNAFALESHTTLNGGKKVVHTYVKKLTIGDEADLNSLEIPAHAEVQDMTALMKF